MPENINKGDGVRRHGKAKPVSEGSRVVGPFAILPPGVMPKPRSQRGRPKSKKPTVNVQFKLTRKTARKLRSKVAAYKRSQFAEAVISEALREPEKKMKSALARDSDSMQDGMQPEVKE